jgi:hypothetical protein
VWRKSVFDIYFTEFSTALTTILPILFQYCYKYCYSDSRMVRRRILEAQRWQIIVIHATGMSFKIGVITKLPNSEQSCKGKVKTDNYINRQNQLPEPLSRNESGRFGALKSDSTHHFFRNACTKSGSLRFSQFSGCWLILSIKKNQKKKSK